MRTRPFTDVDLNRSVGNLLRLGVLLSVVTSLVGFIKLFTEGFKMPRKYNLLVIEDAIVHYFYGDDVKEC